MDEDLDSVAKSDNRRGLGTAAQQNKRMLKPNIYFMSSKDSQDEKENSKD